MLDGGLRLHFTGGGLYILDSMKSRAVQNR